MDPVQARLEELRKQVAALEAERDEFKRLYLGELARNMPEATQADLDAAIPTGPWFEDFIQRLERGDSAAMDSWPKS